MNINFDRISFYQFTVYFVFYLIKINILFLYNFTNLCIVYNVLTEYPSISLQRNRIESTSTTSSADKPKSQNIGMARKERWAQQKRDDLEGKSCII